MKKKNETNQNYYYYSCAVWVYISNIHNLYILNIHTQSHNKNKLHYLFKCLTKYFDYLVWYGITMEIDELSGSLNVFVTRWETFRGQVYIIIFNDFNVLMNRIV